MEVVPGESQQQQLSYSPPVENVLPCDVTVDVNMDAELSMFLDMMDPGLGMPECGYGGGVMNFAVDVNVDGIVDVGVDWDALVSDPVMQDIVV
ncbi:hypothetical protein BHE90_017615 [Fusarium euwallaceae]|uniref:Uncharacterized protein n=1 Tax=Fusarium euwallaceae TaxID=1147111 RepID=A0A430KWY7_9HYPO|nr:hypothetical protein BHE90_017615 [Fusarium euwallaceae]